MRKSKDKALHLARQARKGVKKYARGGEIDINDTFDPSERGQIPKSVQLPIREIPRTWKPKGVIDPIPSDRYHSDAIQYAEGGDVPETDLPMKDPSFSERWLDRAGGAYAMPKATPGLAKVLFAEGKSRPGGEDKDWSAYGSFGELKGTAPEDTPIAHRTKNPLTNITEGDIDRGLDVGMGAGPGVFVGPHGYAMLRASGYKQPNLGYSKSGMSRGADGMARMEVPDVGASLKQLFPGSDKYYLDHPAGDFHKIYDIPPITVDRELAAKNALMFPDTSQVIIGGKGASEHDLADSALHELQHIIQKKEGFSRGANPNHITHRPEYKQEAFPDHPMPSWQKERYGDVIRQAGKDPEDMVIRHKIAEQMAYERAAGETEARNVQARFRDPNKYRMHPEDTEDIPRGLQWHEKYAGGGEVGNFNPERASAFGLARQGMIKSQIPGRTDKINMKVPTGSYIIPADIPSAIGEGNSDAGGAILGKMLQKGPYGMNLPRRKAGMRIGKRKASLSASFAEGGSTDGADPWKKWFSQNNSGSMFQNNGGSMFQNNGSGMFGQVPFLGGLLNMLTGQGGQQQPAPQPQAQRPLTPNWGNTPYPTYANIGINNQPANPTPFAGLANRKFAEGGETGMEMEEGGEDHTPIVAAGGEFVVHPDAVAHLGGGDIDLGHAILDDFVKQIREKNIKTLKGLKPPKGSE